MVSIPVKVYTATSPQNVRFNQLHKECGSRIKQKLHCPTCDVMVEREDLVKGYEVHKGQYVQFSAEEMTALEAERFQTLDLVEFVPESSVDFIHIEKSYYIGPDKGGDKAFNLLSKAMRRTERIAVGRYWWRGKVNLVLLRPYKKGLILHHVYYQNEVRDYEDVDVGDDQPFSEAEEALAEQLIGQLTVERFEPRKYHDEYAARVREAADQKVAGQEVTTAPEQPAAQIIDLFEALKQSLSEAEMERWTGTDDAAPAEPPKARPPRKSPKGGPKKAKRS